MALTDGTRRCSLPIPLSSACWVGRASRCRGPRGSRLDSPRWARAAWRPLAWWGRPARASPPRDAAAC
eukprot:3388510-Pleurochrysis_carterae.AAC.5